MKKGIITLCSAAALAGAGWLGFSACPAQAQEKVAATPEKVLVAYFSWGGNTRAAAQAAADATGGTLAEIKAVKPYPAEYSACVEQAKKEIRENHHPAIVVQPAVDVSQYDVILVGSPNWWSTIAPPVASFLKANDLAGKKVALFVTHGGGGMAHCEKDATRLAKKATMLKGAAFSGSTIESHRGDVREWVHSIISLHQ